MLKLTRGNPPFLIPGGIQHAEPCRQQCRRQQHLPTSAPTSQPVQENLSPHPRIHPAYPRLDKKRVNVTRQTNELYCDCSAAE